MPPIDPYQAVYDPYQSVTHLGPTLHVQPSSLQGKPFQGQPLAQ